MSFINPNKQCCVCGQVKLAISESLFDNGLYGYYCKECDEKE